MPTYGLQYRGLKHWTVWACIDTSLGLKCGHLWAAFFRSYRDVFLAVRIAFLSIAEVEIEDIFTAAIHVFGVALIANVGVSVSAFFGDDLEAVCYFTSEIRGVYLPTLSIQVAEEPTLVWLRIWSATLAW